VLFPAVTLAEERAKVEPNGANYTNVGLVPIPRSVEILRNSILTAIAQCTKREEVDQCEAVLAKGLAQIGGLLCALIYYSPFFFMCPLSIHRFSELREKLRKRPFSKDSKDDNYSPMSKKARPTTTKSAASGAQSATKKASSNSSSKLTLSPTPQRPSTAITGDVPQRATAVPQSNTPQRKTPSKSNGSGQQTTTKDETRADDAYFQVDGGPSTNGAPLWRFFSPGNRNFLDTKDGRLQIIGSRRIQMHIESLPVKATFLNAALYIEKVVADRGVAEFELIQTCVKCQENGIPKAFCLLPRRGREHDTPWVTFRITCTSSIKHWRGASFRIGAEFQLDPNSANNITRFFSPPINVQSKLRGKEREAILAARAASSAQEEEDEEELEEGVNDSLTSSQESVVDFSAIPIGTIPTFSLATESSSGRPSLIAHETLK
jgi:hypothetical protein